MFENNKEFKIIKIINSYNILINGGSINGLKENSKLEVYSKGEEIIVDDINYGTLDNIKATLEIKTLYPKMALCQSDKIIKKRKYSPIEENFNYKKNLNYLKYSLLKQGLIPEIIEEVAPLTVKNPENNDLSYLENNTIIVGDLVREKK